MSLARVSTWSPAVAGRTCARCFSSGVPKRDQGLLEILNASNAAQNQLAGTKNGPSTAMKLAQSLQTKQREVKVRDEMLDSEQRASYQKQMYRKWKEGDVYQPYDLSGTEQKKWKMGKTKPQSDAFDILGVNPVNEYKNFTMMSEFMTEMGRIKHSKDTGLRPKNQRKVAKAIRRAIGLGLMPSVHRHPLVLKNSHPTRFL